MNIHRKTVIIVLSLFLLQWIAQSFPHHETIMAGGEEVCTCGCGHTVAVCAASHQALTLSGVDCSCQHQQTKVSFLVFVPHKIADLTLARVPSFAVTLFQQYCTTDNDQKPFFVDREIPNPPPQTRSS